MDRLPIRRRQLIVGGLAATASGIAGHAFGQSGEVIAAGPGGLQGQLIKDNFYTPFQEATGIRVRQVSIEIQDQWARIRAAQANGTVPFDLIVATPPDLIEKRDILAPMDCSDPNIANNIVPDTCYPYGIVRDFNAMVMTWSTKAFPNGGPQTWAEFYDTKRFPGSRTFPDTGDRDWWVPVTALLADGVDRSALFPMDLDRAYRKLDTIKPQISAWWKSSDNFMQIAGGSEAVLLMGYASRSIKLARTGNFNFNFNEAIPIIGNWAMLANSPNPENAKKFLDFYYQNPKAHAALTMQLDLNSNNRDLITLLPKEEQPRFPSYPANWAKMLKPDFDWISSNRSRLRERFISWYTS